MPAPDTDSPLRCPAIVKVSARVVTRNFGRWDDEQARALGDAEDGGPLAG
jgi:hypothetical protein